MILHHDQDGEQVPSCGDQMEESIFHSRPRSCGREDGGGEIGNKNDTRMVEQNNLGIDNLDPGPCSLDISYQEEELLA
jgi:hypothetical protein